MATGSGRWKTDAGRRGRSRGAAPEKLPLRHLPGKRYVEGMLLPAKNPNRTEGSIWKSRLFSAGKSRQSQHLRRRTWAHTCASAARPPGPHPAGKFEIQPELLSASAATGNDPYTGKQQNYHSLGRGPGSEKDCIPHAEVYSEPRGAQTASTLQLNNSGRQSHCRKPQEVASRSDRKDLHLASFTTRTSGPEAGSPSVNTTDSAVRITSPLPDRRGGRASRTRRALARTRPGDERSARSLYDAERQRTATMRARPTRRNTERSARATTASLHQPTYNFRQSRITDPRPNPRQPRPDFAVLSRSLRTRQVYRCADHDH